ncbi:HIT family protein [Planococcus sp. YIM B11945]|uniref:HIT family protein n=1 Tax=Planococcus sp. YIM B11945 TaxID=3435410 RepID=UPI003D7DA277
MKNKEAKSLEENEKCLGCALTSKSLPVLVVYEDDNVCCFLDHDPFNEGHTLILPKQHYHYIDEMDGETINSIMHATQLVSKAIKNLFNPDGITICQNGGKFDDLTHFHMHVVPRFENQPFAEFYTDEPWENEKLRNKLPFTRIEIAEAIQHMMEQKL